MRLKRLSVVLVTEGTRADCAEAGTLIEGLVAAHLIADKGYDSTAIIQQAQRQGMEAVKETTGGR